MLRHEIDERRWARILETIPAALQGTYPLEERLTQVRATYPTPRSQITPAVHLDNTASNSYSVLEVTAQDRSGLLHAITHVLHELWIDIPLAKVDTLGPEVFDAFYIHRENGRRVEDPDEIERLNSTSSRRWQCWRRSIRKQVRAGTSTSDGVLRPSNLSAVFR